MYERESQSVIDFKSDKGRARFVFNQDRIHLLFGALDAELSDDSAFNLDTTYLFIQGHHLYDNVVLPMVSKVCERLRRERETEIHNKAVHHTQMRNELSSYQHSIEAPTAMLKKNIGYKLSPQYQRLKADIQHYLSHLKPLSAPQENNPSQI